MIVQAGGGVSNKIPKNAVNDSSDIFGGKTFSNGEHYENYTVSNGKITYKESDSDEGSSDDKIYNYGVDMSSTPKKLYMQVEKINVAVEYKKDNNDDYTRVYEFMDATDYYNFLGSSRWVEYNKARITRNLGDEYDSERDDYIEEYFPNAKTDEEKEKITNEQIIDAYINDRKTSINKAKSSGEYKKEFEKLFTYTVDTSESTKIKLTGVCGDDFNLKNMNYTGGFRNDADSPFYIESSGYLEYYIENYDDGSYDSYSCDISSSEITDSGFTFKDENGAKKNATYTINKEDGVKVIITYNNEEYTYTFEPDEITLTKVE